MRDSKPGSGAIVYFRVDAGSYKLESFRDHLQPSKRGESLIAVPTVPWRGPFAEFLG